MLVPAEDVDRWWNGDADIDILSLEPKDDQALLTGCEWTTDPVGEGLFESLRAKAANVRWGPPDRDERFALFSKSGFVEGLEAQLDDSWSLFRMEDIDDLPTPSSVLPHQS